MQKWCQKTTQMINGARGAPLTYGQLGGVGVVVVVGVVGVVGVPNAFSQRILNRFKKFFLQ